MRSTELVLTVTFGAYLTLSGRGAVMRASAIDHFPQEVGWEKVETQITDRISGKPAKSNTGDSEAADSDVTFACGPFTFPGPSAP